jgi:hypothetical protein
MGQVRTVRGVKAILALALLAGGCATVNSSPPPSNTQLAAAERSVKAARDAGAATDPRASRHLRDAERGLAGAKQAAANGDNRAAVLALARAEVDAEYGHALYLEARATRQAELTERQLAETRATPARTPAPPPAAPAAPASSLPTAPPLPAAPSAPAAN